MDRFIPDHIRPLRRVEYEKLVEHGAFVDERLELVEGWLVPMSPIGPSHGSSVQKLTHLLVVALDGRAVVRVQLPFAALDTSEPEPDVALVALGDYDTAHPSRALLVIEVAESSLQHDRVTKQRIYARCGVPEYWIVNLIDKRIEVYRAPSGDAYSDVRHAERGESVALQEFPDVVVQVSAVIKG